jgi:hypothetical protein
VCPFTVRKAISSACACACLTHPLLLWLSIPSGFLVVFEKPNRSSFTFTFTPIPQINFVSKLLREADSSAVAQLRSRDPDHPLLALLKQRQDAEREKDVYVRPMMPWACSGPRPRLLGTWSMPPCVRGGW